MPLVDPSQLDIKIGEYRAGSSTALADPRLLPRAQAWRRTVAGSMKALDREGLRHVPAAPASAPYHVSRKIDGEFTLLVIEDGEAVTVNPGGTARAGLPFMAEAARLLAAAGGRRALVAGELYYARDDGSRPRVHDVTRVARRPESAEELPRLRFAAFDLLEIDGEEPHGHADAWKRIEAIFGSGERIRPVESRMVREVPEIQALFEQWVVKEGGEGLVVRGEAGFFKVKPRHSIDAMVLGFAEATDDRVGMLHDVLIGLMRPDGTMQIAGHVGGGFTEEQRRSMLSDLKDRVAATDYAEVNSDRVAYEMVRPGLVVELSCLDAISQTTRGATIDRMALRWDEAGATWRAAGRMPLASLISPQFVRVREDKGFERHDVRVEQLCDIVEIPDLDRGAADTAAAPSEMVRRRVMTKVMKGQTMVRKLAIWKTNKESTGKFPAFVLHFTDYSPNRVKALQREIRVGNSLEQLDGMWDRLAEKNFVRGWNEAG